MVKDLTEIKSGLDRKLQLRHLPFTRAIDNFVIFWGKKAWYTSK